MRIVFMGTPDFAVPSLKTCADSYEVVGVFCQPDRPAGRGYKLTPPPVKIEALGRELPVFQPNSLKSPQVAAQIADLNPDLIVVVAYGQILPAQILEIPPLGCVNVHGSLLPKYRGAAPIQWAMINGEKETGVTTIYMDAGLDTGDIILSRTMPITPQITGGELWTALSHLGADCLKETLDLIARGEAPRTPQDHNEASYAPKLTKADGQIDFNQPAEAVLNRIRGVTPWPGASTDFGGERLKIHAALPARGQGQPGEILDSKRLVVATADGAVELTKVQLPGKAALTGSQMMQGRRLNAGDFIR